MKWIKEKVIKLNDLFGKFYNNFNKLIIMKIFSFYQFKSFFITYN